MAFNANDCIAHVLAVDYGFCPPRIISPARARILDHGKYETVGDPFDSRTMLLAHWKDHTNVLIRFDPLKLTPPNH